MELIRDTGEKFKSKDLISVIVGKETAVTKSYKLEQSSHFGFGKEEKDNYWKTILRQATVQNFLQKDIETYGVLKITEKGKNVLSGKSKDTFLIAEDREFDLTQAKADSDQLQQQAGGGLDQKLFTLLKELRKK